MSTTPPVWQRYVAIGDSFTEGMCDEEPGQGVDPERYAGWADRLAARLGEHAGQSGRPFAYANLAVRGRLLTDIVGPQLTAALAQEPDLVSIVGGGNDLLRPKVDPSDLAVRLERAVATIRATGADVLMATPVDPREAPIMKLSRSRYSAYTAEIFSIAQRHGAYVVDQWGLDALRDWRMWVEDRIHMSSEGHRRVAEAAAFALGLPTDEADWRTPRVDRARLQGKAARAADREWARQHVVPWVQRRMKGTSSGDHIAPKRPLLLPLTVDESATP